MEGQYWIKLPKWHNPSVRRKNSDIQEISVAAFDRNCTYINTMKKFEPRPELEDVTAMVLPELKNPMI